MNEYETVCIMQPDLPSARQDKIRDRIQKLLSDNQAEVVDQKDWGKRKLAYRIGKFLFGHYLYFDYIGTGRFIAELERILKYEEGVIRYLTVKVAEDTKKENAAGSPRVNQPEEMKFGEDPRFKDSEGYRGGRNDYMGGHYAEEN